MNRVEKTVLIILLFVSTPLLTYGAEEVDIATHLKISTLQAGGAPEVWYNKILFSYGPAPQTRHVGISFAHENFRNIYTLQKNEYNVFTILADPPPKSREVHYRFIVNGVWSPDPNGTSVREIGTVTSSLYRVPEWAGIGDEEGVTIDQDSSLVLFQLKGYPQKDVYLVGDFNNWDPYMTPMKEQKPGVYKTSLKLTSGRYHYYYIVNGSKINDPYNLERAWNRENEEVSLFIKP